MKGKFIKIIRTDEFTLPETGVIQIAWKDDTIKTGCIEFAEKRIVSAKIEDIYGNIEKKGLDAALDILSQIHTRKLDHIELYATIEPGEPLEDKTKIGERIPGVIELMSHFKGAYVLDNIDICSSKNLSNILNSNEIYYNGKLDCNEENLKKSAEIFELFEFKKEFERKIITSKLQQRT